MSSGTASAKQAVFIGDSLLQWFTHDGNQYWTKYFTSTYNCLNLGVPGDSTEQTIQRLNHGMLSNHTHLLPSSIPKVCTLLIGTNDIGRRFGEEYIATNIKTIMSIIESQLVNVQILLIGILPRGSLQQMPALINQIISKYENGSSIRYLDMSKQFSVVHKSTKSSGGGVVKLNTNLYWPDQLHLSTEGYRVWAETMHPIFKEMMDNTSV